VQKPILPNGPGGVLPETPVCKKSGLRGPQESSGVWQKMLQILEAGLGISVNIKASPS
jgi:hypothetical protein